MANILHSAVTPQKGIHTTLAWPPLANEAAVYALTLTSTAVGKVALALDTLQPYMATSDSTWFKFADAVAVASSLASKASQAALDAAIAATNASLATKADKATVFNTPLGSGLSGGGSLAADRSLSADVKTVFGRIGNVTGAASDIANDSTQIPQATYPTVATAIDRLAAMIAAVSGGGAAVVSSVFSRTGDIVAQAADYAAFYVPLTRTVIAGSGLSGGGALSSNVTLTAAIQSVFGRTGVVSAALDDYKASLITNDSSVTGATVQLALNALSSLIGTKADNTAVGNKADKTIVLTAGTGLTGGGDLSQNRTFTANVYSVHGRMNSVVGQAGDYDNIYVPVERTITTAPGSGLSGGGTLLSNRTLAADVKSVFGRTGNVTASAVDIANDSTGYAPGTYATVTAVLNQVATQISTNTNNIATNTSAIANKVDTSTYTTGLAAKVDTSTYTTGLAGKADKLLTINAQTGTTYTLVLSDADTRKITLSNASPITLTIPTNAAVPIPVGSVIAVAQFGAGQVTIVGAGGVTLLTNYSAPYKTAAQHGPNVMLEKVATDTWQLSGGLFS